MADSEQRAGLESHPHERESLLVLARPSDEGAAAYYRDQVAPIEEPDAAWIAVLSDPVRVRRPDVFAGGPGAVVSVGDSTRSAAESVGPDAAGTTEVDVAAGDLVTAGRTVDDYLEAWAAEGRRPVVCVDSLVGVLTRGSIKGAYRFLFVLHRRVEACGGTLHVHADPGAHEEEILRTFFSLFDRVVSFQDGGAGRS